MNSNELAERLETIGRHYVRNERSKDSLYEAARIVRSAALPEGTLSLTGNELTISFATRDEAEKAMDALEALLYRPRPMTGFISTLSEKQKEAALAFDGDDAHGEEKTSK